MPILKKNISRKWRWIVTVVYIFAIYAFLPFAPGFWKFVLRILGEKANSLGFLFVCIMGACFLFFLIFRKKTKNISVYVAFFFISLACLALLKYMCVAGAERFHLLLYGILSGVLFWTLKIDVKNRFVYLYITLLMCLVGAVDEFIQALLPMRCFDMRDIVMNWFSGGLGELFIAFVLQPSRVVSEKEE